MNFLAKIALLIFLVCLPVGTQADDKYANVDPTVRAWYARQQLTEETRNRLNVAWKGCCDHADVFRTQFRVNRQNGGDEWWYLDGAEWKLIPADTVQPDIAAPDNQPTLFIYQGKETCFFPGGAGG